jgi:hypothetical protein
VRAAPARWVPAVMAPLCMLWYILGTGAAPWSLTGTRPTPPTSPGTGCALGAREEGRVLFLIFTRRRGRVRAITARDATPEEKRRYRKRGK